MAKFAKTFGVTMDYLMDDSEKQAEYSFKDKQLLEYFLKVDKLNEEDRNLIKGVIESVLAKSKVEYQQDLILYAQ